MPIYKFDNKTFSEVPHTSFEVEEIYERLDLQVALKNNIEIISPDTLIISEEFAGWTEGKRRIDLLGIDRQANLVVIELKRDETGSYMELQALRYAAMVSTMTFEKVVDIFQQYLDKQKLDQDAEAIIFDFLDDNDFIKEDFPLDVRIILASADFSKEITTTVMWLNERDLDIRCVRLQPYKLDSKIIINIEQIIPLPEAEEYQIKVRDKVEARRAAIKSTRDMTKYRFLGEVYSKRRLVLAVVTHYFKSEPDSTLEKLQAAFPNNIHPSFGVVARFKEAQNKGGKHRYFMEEDQLLKTQDGDIVAVCNQWGIGNIKPILEIANKLGYQIDEV